MVCQYTKKYIMEQAKEKGVVVPTNYEEVLETYCQVVENYGHRLEFRKGCSLTYNNIGANAGIFKNSSIIATPEWAFQLVTNQEKANLAFMITLGHELTHKEKDVFCLCSLKFCAWVNEVHADFGATQKMFNCDRGALIEAINFKLTYLEIHEKGDKEDETHPSWARRKHYAESFDFDAKLMQQIAMDVGCTNKKLIGKVCKHFQEIKLV